MKTFLKTTPFIFIKEPDEAVSNYWLNAILMKDIIQRDEFLQFTNNAGIMTRPAWRLINQLEMYKNCQTTDISNSIEITERLVNLPSSYSNTY